MQTRLTNDDMSTQGSNESIVVGDWYIVQYEDKQFPGEVLDVRRDAFQVYVMDAVGKYWKWPTRKDAIFYMKNKMISKLAAPNVVNNCGHFKISVQI